jgi:uncharacterized FlgJ-related protein
MPAHRYLEGVKSESANEYVAVSSNGSKVYAFFIIILESYMGSNFIGLLRYRSYVYIDILLLDIFRLENSCQGFYLITMYRNSNLFC